MDHFTIYTHNYILDSLEYLIEGKDVENYTAVQKIPIITMLAFMYEAIANHYGEEILKIWKDEVEPKMTPMGKLQLLAEIKGFNLDISKAPYQSCSQILKLRNLLAHPKTEKIKFTPGSGLPEPAWKTKLDQVNIRVAYEDLKSILNAFPSNLGLEVTPSLILGEVRGNP